MTDLEATRQSLHAVAELLLAGPQYAEHDTVRLSVTADGFTRLRDPSVEVVGTRLRVGSDRVDLSGRTVADVAAEVGITPRALGDVYKDATALGTDHVLTLDASAADVLHDGWRRGDAALAEFAPDADRVLWPEHFDVAIHIDRVDYGVSPGDHHYPKPYAYVGPWDREGLSGDFWNAAFGAARLVSEIDDIAAYFAEGAALLARRA